jgi:glyoxylase-like metal-dependent hydrolase (beta-lactamase superfamily II)
MRRRRLLYTLPLAAGGLTPGARYLINLFNKPEYEMQLLRGNVGCFKERGGTIGWLIEDDAIVVVDAQFPEQAEHLIEELRKESQAPIEWLINTHHHHDHTAGNIVFKDVARHVLAHENSLKNQKASARAGGDESAQLYPDMTYQTSWSQDVGTEHISMEYWGHAHTDGDSIIHFTKSNIVHLGDLVFNRRHPYIDKGAGASIENWILMLEKACSYFDDDTLFLFGHSDNGHDVKGGKDDIRAFRNYLTRVLEHVGGLLKAGKAEEEIMKTSVIPGAEEWQGDGIERSLRAAVLEIRDGK